MEKRNQKKRLLNYSFWPRKLLKGGSNSKEETIQGRVVDMCIFLFRETSLQIVSSAFTQSLDILLNLLQGRILFEGKYSTPVQTKKSFKKTQKPI